MKDAVSALSLESSELMFRPQTGHCLLSLHQPLGARVLWSNPAATQIDPQAQSLSSQEYREHILARCAYIIMNGSGTSAIAGVADRYGGYGIGCNGGSGRAAYLNGYNVKGVGRTPLVHPSAPLDHSSGTTSLEECVRETILAELVHARHPHGAIRSLAIIDIAEQDVNSQAAGSDVSIPSYQRKCLLVRPAFIRPAHFERAPRFPLDQPVEGHIDADRVRSMFAVSNQLFGKERLFHLLKMFWRKWAEQMAYGFIHRCPHTTWTTSNACLDGRLLDFGAMIAIPAWGRYIWAIDVQPTGRELAKLALSAKYAVSNWFRYAMPSINPMTVYTNIVADSMRVYRRTLLREGLWLLGLERPNIIRILAEPQITVLHRALGEMIRFQSRRGRAMTIGESGLRPRWQLAQVWSNKRNVPDSYIRMRGAILTAIREIQGREPGEEFVRASRHLCQRRSESFAVPDVAELSRLTISEFGNLDKSADLSVRVGDFISGALRRYLFNPEEVT